MKILALDLGGTRLKVGVVVDGTVEQVRATPAHADVRALLDEAAPAGDFDGAGLCVPGLVSGGRVVSLPGKLAGLEGVDLLGIMRERFGERAVVCNDAIAYATGEAVGGAGRGCARVLVVTIGTGVGVTLVEQGVARAETIFGGFIPISDRSDGPLDSNGRPDTIEALCRADRIGPDPAAVYAAFERGDRDAREAVATYRANLVRALTALASAHAPERIVLGGGPMTPDNPVARDLSDDVSARLFGSNRVEIGVASLGDAAALVGLAHLVVRI